MPGSDHGEDLDRKNLIRVCSHPGKLLEKHLTRSLEIATQILHGYGIELSPAYLDAICLHDLGKAHPSFQRKLCRKCYQRDTCVSQKLGMQSRDRLEGGSHFAHAEPSAAFLFTVTKDPLAAEIVRRHHTQIENLSDVHKHWFSMRYHERAGDGKGVLDVFSKIPLWPGIQEIIKSLYSIDPSLASLMTRLSEDRKGWIQCFPLEDEWKEAVRDAWDDLVYGSDQSNGGPGLSDLWLKTRLAYSILVTADRWEASTNSEFRISVLKPDENRIQQYLNTFEPSETGFWRDQVRRAVVTNARQLIKKPGVYTITLPTGTGKTLIGLSIAQDVAREFNATGIIYCLPYISIVEQNADVAAKIFDDVQEDHSLAYVSDNSQNETRNGRKANQKNLTGDETLEASARFIAFYRYWRSPVVVTTLAKMWEVLFSPKANDTMSFHRLSHSVVIFDEPQTIPPRVWNGFGKVLSLLAEKAGATFILMTATQPEIGEKGSRTELAPEPVRFPINRYSVEWLGEKQPEMGVLGLTEFIKDKNLEKEDVLAVMNTKDCALRLYCELRKMGAKPFLLSRWVTPNDRRAIMRHIHDLEEKEEPRWLVATQVVEAGVDLDFGWVIRDLGPLDSIVQVAGRCNRHGKRETEGKVFVLEMVDMEHERKRRYSSLYDSVLLDQTKQVLTKHPVFSEGEVRDVVLEYYRFIRSGLENSSLWQDIAKGNWAQYSSLIEEEKYGAKEVMLIIDKDGSIGDLAREALIKPEGFEDLDKKRNLFRQVSQHAIEVKKEALEAWIAVTDSCFVEDREPSIEPLNEEGSIWLLNPKAGSSVYFEGIGFVPLDVFNEYEDVLRKPDKTRCT